MTERHARILGGLWTVIGGLTLIYVASEFWGAVMNPRQRYEARLLYLAYIMLPFGIVALVNGTRGLSGRRLPQVLTIPLSLLVLGAGGLYLLAPGIDVLRRSSTPEEVRSAIEASVLGLVLILFGLYNLGVIALRAKGGR